MSSAKHNSWQCLRNEQAQLTNSDKSIGDKCPPWGTPVKGWNTSKFGINSLTHYARLTRNELNQERSESLNHRLLLLQLRAHG